MKTDLLESSGLKQSVGGFSDSIISKIPFHDWPHWGIALKCLGIFLILWIIYWFWYHFVGAHE